MGVIHEWGCHSPENLLDLIQSIDQLDNFTQITLLSPPSIEAEFLTYLKNFAQVDFHYLALVKKINPVDLKELFIWGLDSI